MKNNKCRNTSWTPYDFFLKKTSVVLVDDEKCVGEKNTAPLNSRGERARVQQLKKRKIQAEL